MEGKHYVLVSTAQAGCKLSCVISEDVIDRDSVDVDGRCGRREGTGRAYCGHCHRVHRSNVLSGLCHVSLECFVGVWAVSWGQGVDEAWP